MTRTCISFCILFLWQLLTQRQPRMTGTSISAQSQMSAQSLILHRTNKSLTSQNESEIPGRIPHVCSVVIIRISKLFLKLAIIVRQVERGKKDLTTEHLPLKQYFPLLQRKPQNPIQKLLFKKIKGSQATPSLPCLPETGRYLHYET